jgi:hypothetical protein
MNPKNPDKSIVLKNELNLQKSRFANPESSQIQAGGLVNPDLRVRTVKICIADLIHRPFFKILVSWIQFVRPTISNYSIHFVLEGTNPAFLPKLQKAKPT